MESQPVHFIPLQFDSKEYHSTILLRDRILRKPLGLEFDAEKLKLEFTEFHIGAYINDKLIGCAVLTPDVNNLIQMRQVAIEEGYQGKGTGKQLVVYLEDFCKEKGFTTLFCHARETAVPFYIKLGYRIVSEQFIEVNIPHFKMEKLLK